MMSVKADLQVEPPISWMRIGSGALTTDMPSHLDRKLMLLSEETSVTLSLVDVGVEC